MYMDKREINAMAEERNTSLAIMGAIIFYADGLGEIERLFRNPRIMEADCILYRAFNSCNADFLQWGKHNLLSRQSL